jgi:hypothetical protein
VGAGRGARELRVDGARDGRPGERVRVGRGRARLGRYASPAEATRAPAEEFLYVACLHEATGVEQPDFIAVVEVDEGRIVHELPMPNVGDELHHYGWNRCSGGVLGRPSDAGRPLDGGPQMLQLSLDGRRLYVTNSLYSTWDEQFCPGLHSWLLRVTCDPGGGMELDRDFFVNFHDQPGGPARAHEMRLQGGDCTTEIFS